MSKSKNKNILQLILIKKNHQISNLGNNSIELDLSSIVQQLNGNNSITEHI